MKKVMIIIIFILTTAVCLSNGLKDDNKIYYKNFVVVNKNKHISIHIEYPQLKGVKPLKEQEKINKLIMKKAVFTLYDEDEEIINGLDLNVKAEIQYFSLDLISIKYSAQSHYWNTMKVYEKIYTTNIDIENGVLVNYKELFNQKFRGILNRKIFKYSSSDKAINLKKLDKNSYEYGYLYGEEEIIKELFDKFYNEFRDNNYYFSKNKFTIIAEIPDSSEKNIELSTEYVNIKSVINYKYKIWNNFF